MNMNKNLKYGLLLLVIVFIILLFHYITTDGLIFAISEIVKIENNVFVYGAIQILFAALVIYILL